MRYILLTLLSACALAYDQAIAPLLVDPFSNLHLSVALFIGVLLMFDLKQAVITGLIIAIIYNALPSPHAWTMLIIYPSVAVGAHFIVTSLFPKQNVVSFITGTVISFTLLNALMLATTFLLELGQSGQFLPADYWSHLGLELSMLIILMTVCCLIYQRSLARQQTLFLNRT